MELSFDLDRPGTEVFAAVVKLLDEKGLHIDSRDEHRPWGGFFVISEADSAKFINAFFPHLTQEDLVIAGKLSPKILMVAPGKRLSWQYHHRRAEIWKLVGGEARIMTSDDDEETVSEELHPGDIVQLGKGKRHRLMGADESWGIVAEIWQHTDADDPSDEDDIVRLQDDFGR